MSWFDRAGLASFAKSALNTAQKTIDKALDIKDENITSDGNSGKKPDADSFFEAFGLNDQPSTSQPTSKSYEKENAIPNTSTSDQNEILPQGSGFWTETWGSIFEMKGPITNTPNAESKPICEDVSLPKSSSTKTTVQSQPHRTVLFPKDTPSTVPVMEDVLEDSRTDNLVTNTDNVEQDRLFSQSEHVVSTPPVSSLKNDESATVESSSENLPLDSSQETLKSSSNSSDIVTKQPAGSTENILDVTLPDCSLNDLPSNNANSEVVIESICDSESNPVSLEDGRSKLMEQSEFLNIEMPLEDDPQILVPEENGMVASLESFTQVERSEVEASISEEIQFEEHPSLESSVVVISESIANWECSTPSPDVLTAEESDNSDVVAHQAHLLERTTPTDNAVIPDCESFHQMEPQSHTEWRHEEFSHDSQNSSNEERNSHHSEGSSNSSKDDDTDTTEAKECQDDGKSTGSSGSSFVKCSVDENDSSSHRGQSPSSDVTKHESEQNSADEAETATSSDIEVLNGENGDRKHIWAPKPYRVRRSESPTSDSSKDSMMPVVNELEELSCEEEVSSPTTMFEKGQHECQKDYREDNLEALLQKQIELQNILESREKKLVELSRENIELQENEERLKKLVQKMRTDQEKESKDISSLTREFTQKLAKVESQLKDVVMEKGSLQLQLDETKDEISKRISAADVEEVIKDKDQQIQELLEEGQKLSKKELLHTTIIKKLRAKKDELEQTVQSQDKKLEENSKEVERLRKSIFAKEDQEKIHIDAIRELTSAVAKLEKELSTFKSDHEDSREKERSLKKSLDSTYKDLTDLKKAYAVKEIEVQELKSGLELEAKENLQQMLETVNKEAKGDKERLLSQMQELRYSITQADKEANIREKSLRDEIMGLQKRLQESEERNEDLSKNMSSATRPLVRQMENLQSTFTSQTISWEKVEKNLTDRLSDAQNQVALMSEKERAATEKYMEFQSRVTALESHNTTLRQEKLHLAGEIETLKTQIIVLEENMSRENYTIEKMKQNHNAEVTKLKQDKANVEGTMSTCLEQLDLEKRKVQKLEEEIKIKETRALIMTGSSPCPSPTGSARSSISSMHNWSMDEAHETGRMTPINNYRMSVYDSLRLGSSSSLLESLQSQLKQREGEIIQLQSEISKLEHVKESMTRELVSLSEQNEILDRKLCKLESLEKDHKELDQKYNTLLQMYGEKVEETEELQLDLSDVKSMYKAQIEELLMKK